MSNTLIICIQNGRPAQLKQGSHESLVIWLLRAGRKNAAEALANIESDTNGFVDISGDLTKDGEDLFPNDGWYASFKATKSPGNE